MLTELNKIWKTILASYQGNISYFHIVEVKQQFKH